MSHERTSTYLHLLKALEEAYGEESGCEMDPLFVIFDGFAAITAPMRMSFPGCSRAMC